MNLTETNIDTACRLSALTLVRSPAGGILLLTAADRPGWQLPGGHVLTGEMPHLAARRHLLAATGLDQAAPTDLLITDYQPPDPPRRRPERLYMVFDAGTVAADAPIIIAGGPPAEHAFVPPASLRYYCHARRLRTLTQALAALHDPGQRGYRVAGQTV